MVTLSNDRLAALLVPYLGSKTVPEGMYRQLSAYLDLLLKWNARTNLTAVRDPEDIVRRHFGESLYAGVQLATRLPPVATVLDFGSGAGFPGLPIQLLLPKLRVTLAESQGKKAAFLREVVRTLALSAEVWAGRVEALPFGQNFDAVTLRAVDHMETAIASARERVARGGLLVTLSTDTLAGADSISMPTGAAGYVNFLKMQPSQDQHSFSTNVMP